MLPSHARKRKILGVVVYNFMQCGLRVRLPDVKDELSWRGMRK